jgi:hypothetical protein
MTPLRTNLIRTGLAAGTLMVMINHGIDPVATSVLVIIGQAQTYGGSYVLFGDRGIETFSFRDIEQWIQVDMLKVVVL